jgi:hypothetical protein
MYDAPSGICCDVINFWRRIPDLIYFYKLDFRLLFSKVEQCLNTPSKLVPSLFIWHGGNGPSSGHASLIAALIGKRLPVECQQLVETF